MDRKSTFCGLFFIIFCSQGLLKSFSVHSGSVKGLGNSRFQGNLMVTGAGSGEVQLTCSRAIHSLFLALSVGFEQL